MFEILACPGLGALKPVLVVPLIAKLSLVLYKKENYRKLFDDLSKKVLEKLKSSNKKMNHIIPQITEG